MRTETSYSHASPRSSSNLSSHYRAGGVDFTGIARAIVEKPMEASYSAGYDTLFSNSGIARDGGTFLVGDILRIARTR